MKRNKLGILIVATAFGGMALVCCCAACPPPHGAAPSIVAADAALVLSGDVDYLRVLRAAALYRSGDVRFVLLTGTGVGGDSAAALKVLARQHGVPELAILLEPESTTTWSNLTNSAPLIRASGWRRVALVTNVSHMGRAERVAHRVLPDIDWVPVPVPDPGPRTRIHKVRLQEWVKLLWYRVRGWV